jgi:hypothetical protein
MKPSGARTTPLGNGLESNTPAFERGLRISCKSSGDRGGSNPRPSQEPQSSDYCFQVSPSVAESAYLSRFSCSRLPAAMACCALSSVRMVSAPLSAARDQSLSRERQAGSRRSWGCGGGGPPSPRRPS